MFFYGGGTFLDSNASEYSFWENSVSDLGRTKTLSGKSNNISYIIFTISGCIMAFSLIFFSIAFPKLFVESEEAKMLSNIASLFGVITGILMLSTILTPLDLYYMQHIILAVFYLLAGLIALIFYSLTLYINKDYPKFFAYVFISLTIFGIIHAIIPIFGPNVNISEGMTVQATSQKILLYGFAITFIIQGYGAFKFEKSLENL